MKTTSWVSAPCRHCPLDFFAKMGRVYRWREKQTEAVWFSVTARLDTSSPSDLPAVLEKWIGKGLKMIRWQNSPDRAQKPANLLWQTAKAGIWNHVSAPDLFENGTDAVLARFVLNHPHVVHSFDLPPDRPLPEITHAYEEIDSLPGIPFWQTLAGPLEILSYLGQYPADHLVRMRWARGIRLVLGTEIAFSFKSPADLMPVCLDQIHAMVLAGGAVNATHVRSNLENAYLIGCAMENKK